MAPALAAVCLLAGCTAGDDALGATTVADDVFAIEVGDCLDDADLSGQVTRIPIVDCDEPHDSEAFASTTATGDAYPGDDALDATLVEFCHGDAFEDFVGVRFVDSVYVTGGFYPTAASWASGDRELLCTIRAEGE